MEQGEELNMGTLFEYLTDISIQTNMENLLAVSCFFTPRTDIFEYF